ncbi:tetratricopeptide repeat protein [Micromonospora sp. NPDC050276]|uniref:tetratricopeptide repeat protein n=1 Tax=Micromonospora sp. NPDC050276 TaxID=3364278 RepID=UPI003797909E
MSHPSPLAAAQHRALALRASGDLSAARQLLAEAVESAPPPYGDGHPEMLHTAHVLARLHREGDDPLAARRVLEEAFAAGERRWEHSDPLMLALAFELAEVAEELGNRHEARRNYTRVATAGPAALGENHPAVRAARGYLGAPAPTPGGQQPAPPTPTAAPVTEPGARSALSGPTLSLATLAAMRPPAGGPPAAAVSPWAPPQPPATPQPNPPAVRAPATPTPPGGGTASPVSAPRGTPVHLPLQQRGTEQPVGPARPAGGPLPRPRVDGPPTTPSEPRPAQRPPSGPAVAPRQRVGERATPPVADVPPPPSTPTAPASAAPPAPPAVPAPRWDNPTIRVRQIEPLLAEETARVEARPAAPSESHKVSGTESAAPGRPAPNGDHPGSAYPMSGPPAQPFGAPPPTPQPISVPPSQPSPVSGPPAQPYPVSGPPGYGQPVSGPPGHTYPVSAPPGFGPPVSGPPYGQPVSAPPVSAPPVPPWGLTAPPWSSSAPPQPLPTPSADSAEHTTTAGHTTTGVVAVGADGDSGLGILDAPVAPARQARIAPSDQTEVIPAVAPQGPAEVAARPARPVAAQPAPVAAQPNPSTAPASPSTAQAHPVAAQAGLGVGSAGSAPPNWSPGVGTDPSMPSPTAPPTVGHYHQDQQPPHAQHPMPYPGQQYHPAPEPYRPAYAEEGGSTGRNRTALIGAVVAAGVAVMAVAGLGAVVLTRDDPPPTGAAPTAAPAPTTAGAAPGDLRLRDDSTTITLTWTDPSGGAVPFMVAAGRAGQALGVIATVDPGRTSYTVNGLNSRVDHCFTVLAVYSTDSFATSGQVCTARERTNPSSGAPSGPPSPR